MLLIGFGKGVATVSANLTVGSSRPETAANSTIGGRRYNYPLVAMAAQTTDHAALAGIWRLKSAKPCSKSRSSRGRRQTVSIRTVSTQAFAQAQESQPEECGQCARDQHSASLSPSPPGLPRSRCGHDPRSGRSKKSGRGGKAVSKLPSPDAQPRGERGNRGAAAASRWPAPRPPGACTHLRQMRGNLARAIHEQQRRREQ